jgi:hypothetical protein
MTKKHTLNKVNLTSEQREVLYEYTKIPMINSYLESILNTPIVKNKLKDQISLFRTYLNTGSIALDTKYNKLIDPLSLELKSVKDDIEYQVGWYQNGKLIPNINVIEYSSVDTNISYIEKLMRPYNLYKISQQTYIDNTLNSNLNLSKLDEASKIDIDLHIKNFLKINDFQH